MCGIPLGSSTVETVFCNHLFSQQKWFDCWSKIKDVTCLRPFRYQLQRITSSNVLKHINDGSTKTQKNNKCAKKFQNFFQYNEMLFFSDSILFGEILVFYRENTYPCVIVD